jgi:hypothetical protein
MAIVPTSWFVDFLHQHNETFEKPTSERLMENVQMQGFRNPEE